MIPDPTITSNPAVPRKSAHNACRIIRSPTPASLLFTDVAHRRRERKVIEARRRQIDKQLDATIQDMKHVVNYFPCLVGIVHKLRRVFGTPVGCDRLSRPHRTHLINRVVAYGNDEIQFRTIRRSKLIPALPAGSLRRDPLVFEKLENQRIDFTARKTAGTERTEAVFYHVIQYAFRNDAAGRIAGTQKQHVVDFVRYDYFSPQQLVAAADGSSGAQQVFSFVGDSRPVPNVGAEPSV